MATVASERGHEGAETGAATRRIPDVFPSKPDNLTYCLHNVIASDITPLPSAAALDEFTRANVQLFVNRIFQLPMEDCDEGLFARLSDTATFQLPRVRPVPKPKQKTRWEQFAEEQGIRKRKRSRLVWDDLKKDWVPRYGYKSIKKNEEAAAGIVELKSNEDPFEDKFEKRSKEKEMVKAKQKYRELRNRAEAASRSGKKKGDGAAASAAAPSLVFDGKTGKLSKAQLADAMQRAQISTASFGAFDVKAKKEAKLTKLGVKRAKKVHSAGADARVEQSANASLCQKLLARGE